MTCLKSDENINLCANLLIQKKILILPTDTVYGFSGISGITDEKIRKIKGREEKKPFINLIACPQDIYNYTDDKIPKKIFDFWPGPLTVIVKRKHEKSYLKETESETIALRCPGDEWIRRVIEKCGHSINSTSVNRSGSEVLQKIDDIINEFEREVALIVCNGDSKTSVPSTIVKIENERISVVRQGVLKI